MNWFKNLFKADNRTTFQRGYDYVVTAWQASPDFITARQLWEQEDCQFDYNDFNKGMRKALLDHQIPDLYNI